MLTLVTNRQENLEAQKALKANLTGALNRQGKKNIGFPGGNRDEVIFSNGSGQLWSAFGSAEDAPVPRRWNAFGIFDHERSAQLITVEINIPTEGGRVAGFVARDPQSNATFLMHDGRVGGGKPGVSRKPFLAWSATPLREAVSTDGFARFGIVIGNLASPDLPDRIWSFVRLVRAFKDAAANGDLDTPSFQNKLEEYDRYRDEFSGHKTGRRGSKIDYVSYHGDVVRALRADRETKATVGERVFNTGLVDLLVKKDGALTEIFEVKTNQDRQSIYTAIGQLLTHSGGGRSAVKRTLVLPKGPDLPNDLADCLKSLHVAVQRFALTGREDHQVALTEA